MSFLSSYAYFHKLCSHKLEPVWFISCHRRLWNLETCDLRNRKCTMLMEGFSEGDPIWHEWVRFQTKSRYPLNSNFHSCELLEVLFDKFKRGENKKKLLLAKFSFPICLCEGGQLLPLCGTWERFALILTR